MRLDNRLDNYKVLLFIKLTIITERIEKRIDRLDNYKVLLFIKLTIIIERIEKRIFVVLSGPRQYNRYCHSCATFFKLALSLPEERSF